MCRIKSGPAVATKKDSLSLNKEKHKREQKMITIFSERKHIQKSELHCLQKRYRSDSPTVFRGRERRITEFEVYTVSFRPEQHSVSQP